MTMQILRKYLFIVVLSGVLFFTLALTGCRDSSGGKEPNEMVLNLVLNSRIKSLDPIGMRDEYTNMVASQIFEALYQSHFLKRPYEYEPLLAEEMPQISNDKLTYTIKIKKGVLFQDDACFPGGKGRELKAEDFIYALKRVANIKNLSENWSSLDDKIAGLDEFREYTKSCKRPGDVDYSRPVEGLQTPDDYTLVIKLKRPWPQFLSAALTDVLTSPVAKEAVDYYGKDIVSHPVGTGPFKLKKWQRGSYIELVRNENFRGELYPSEGEPGDAEAGYLDDAGKLIPFADKIVWTIIEESQPAWFLFLQGKLDAKSIPKDNWDEVIAEGGELTPKMKQLNIKLKTFPDPSVFCLGFNMNDPVLGKNKPLRKAINRAIDREKFIELFFGGSHEIAHGIIPPMMPAYNPKIKEKGYARFDPNEAKELLKEAEKIQGGKLPKLEIAMQGTGTFYHQFGQFLTKQLNDIGIEVEVEYMDWPTFQERVNAGDAQMFASGWGVGIPDSQQFFSLFYSKNKAPGPNKLNYFNPEYDKLYEKIEVMSQSPERAQLYRKMELMVLEDCPAAFINHRVAYALHHDWYLNYKPHVFQYGLAKYRRIDMKKRAAYRELLKTIK
jgi:oligopeptide transport system substrate-binding protein